MQKIEDVLVNVIVATIRSKYNLTISDESARHISRKMLNIMQADAKQAFQKNKLPFLKNALRRWYNLTKIPEREFYQHSAFYFASFLQKNYWLIPIKKTWKKMHEYVRKSIKGAMSLVWWLWVGHTPPL